MPGEWSEEWVETLHEAARHDDALVEASRGRHVVIGQEVVDGDQRHRWHFVLDDGEVSVRPGAHDAPDVTLSQDAAVARAVARGETAASTAFVLGHIRIGGNVEVLLELAPALAGLGDVFGAARATSDS